MPSACHWKSCTLALQSCECTKARRDTWSSAFGKPHRYGISTSRELSLALAELAGRTRDITREIYAVEAKDGHFIGAPKAFQKALIHDLEPDGFADTIAQTIAYGLFAAKTEMDTNKAARTDEPSRHDPAGQIHSCEKLFREIEQLGGLTAQGVNFDELGVSALVETLNNARMDFGAGGLRAADRRRARRPGSSFLRDFLVSVRSKAAS